MSSTVRSDLEYLFLFSDVLAVNESKGEIILTYAINYLNIVDCEHLGLRLIYWVVI